MSFTLRTLLAYLDHAPLPTEEREPIQRALDQNPAAQELVHRIRTLMAQPRMASPAVETAGVLQVNQVAEYLDGTSDLDITKKFEQTCLKNDSALSEIAALHQILTDWIDQPTYIGEELRQRIYQFAGSWESTPVLDDEVQSSRTVGREAIQSAAQLLQVRELEAPVETASAKPTREEPVTPAVPNTLPKPDVRPAAMATNAVGSASASEESGQGSWILALLVLVGFGFLWWSQQTPPPMAGLAFDLPAVDKEPSSRLEAPVAGNTIPPLQLPGLPSARPTDETTIRQTAPSATLPPIQMSSGTALPPISLGHPGYPPLPTKDPSSDVSSSVALSIPKLPEPLSELPSKPLELESDLIPSFAEPAPIVSDPIEPVNNDLQDMTAFPLAELKSIVEAPKPSPTISALPPIEEGDDVEEGVSVSSPLSPTTGSTGPGLIGEESRSTESNVASSIAATNPLSSPLAPAPTTVAPAPIESTLPTAPSPLPPSPEAPSPEAPSPLAPSPQAKLPPLEWGKQVGTVVMEAPAGEAHDDWILVLPGGCSQLQVRSPRGKAWNFTFSGVSRYQLHEQQGLPQLSVQRCFLLLQCTSLDETLEIQTPKGKIFVTALTPEAELIFEIRPFLPQGSVASTTAPRYYLGCLGLSGRVMIEHQDREVVLFENKWMVVEPDGQHKSFVREFPPAIATTIQELKVAQVNPDVAALSSLVQSSEGMDELFSIANGNHVHARQTTADQRSLAALWSYCLGQLEPSFSVLNDPQLKSYWDIHIQAIASCLQSDPAASQQLVAAANRHGFNSPIDTRFVGNDPQTIKMSQVSELVTDLEHAQVARRVLALHALKLLTNETFGYDPTSSNDLNRNAIARWKQWLADSTTARISINPTSALVPSVQRE